jgi:hypothetical protein
LIHPISRSVRAVSGNEWLNARVRRFFALLAACIVVGAIAVDPAEAASPTVPANRPTPLAGVENGKVPASRLVRVTASCQPAREAGPSINRLFMLARINKLALDGEECYRPLNLQVDYRNRADQPGANPACVASVGRSPTGAPVGRSYHGWGKASDMRENGRSLTFGSAGFAFLLYNANSLGWNWPEFAHQGQPCPEPWHWEWVGDGGNLRLSPKRGDVIGLLPSADDRGYATVTGLGQMGLHGNFASRGNASSIPLSWVMVGAANTPSRGGYWMAAGDGGVFTFGNARFFGSTARMRLQQPVNGITPSKSGNGYYLLAWDGGVFTFGDARFHGSTGARRLNYPVDGMALTASGNGYWLVASDGGIFSFGDARFFGSLGNKRLAARIIGMARTPSGNGYWLYAADGGVFTFGDAKFFGSLGATRPGSPTVSMTPTKSGNGYWLTTADGQVFSYGDAGRYGSG